MKVFVVTAVAMLLASLLLAVPAFAEKNVPATRNKCTNGEGMLVSIHSPAAVGGTCPTPA